MPQNEHDNTEEIRCDVIKLLVSAGVGEDDIGEFLLAMTIEVLTVNGMTGIEISECVDLMTGE